MPFRNRTSTDIAHEFQQLLRKNGITSAHVVTGEDGGLKLAVLGHDSPLMMYDISREQALALTDWGYNSINKRAYDTFTDIVGRDFYIPRSFVSASNAYGHVALGLHTPPRGQMGILERIILGADGTNFRCWSTRENLSYHLREHTDRTSPFVSTRTAGSYDSKYIRPGELEYGSYGFYFKGNNSQTQELPEQVFTRYELLSNQIDTSSLTALTSVRDALLSDIGKPAISYDTLINSDVYFSKDKWLECLSSHGLVVDEQAKTLTVVSDKEEKAMVSDLTDDEFKTITAPFLPTGKGQNDAAYVSLDDRLSVINAVISRDFVGSVDMAHLKGEQRLDLNLKEDIREMYFPEHNEEIISEPVIEVRGDAIPYSDIMNSDMSFSKDKWLECLSSHGIVIDEDSRTMSVYNDQARVCCSQELTKNELRVLTRTEHRDGTQITLDDRVAVLNDVISRDYQDGIDISFLEGTRRFSSPLLETPPSPGLKDERSSHMNAAEIGEALRNRNFLTTYQDIGRTVSDVSDIAVSQNASGQLRMTAVIDGNTYSHTISQSQYDKFMALDDFHRLRLVDRIFPELDLRGNRDIALKITAAMLAGVAVAGDVSRNLLAPEHYISFVGSHSTGVFYKPGVDTPQDIVERAFELERSMQNGHDSQGLHI